MFMGMKYLGAAYSANFVFRYPSKMSFALAANTVLFLENSIFQN